VSHPEHAARHDAAQRTQADGDAEFAQGHGGYYDIVVGTFVGLLLISNVAATKLFQGFYVPGLSDWFNNGEPLIFDGGAFLFPLSYVVGDVLSEVYGWKRARRAIWLGFAMMGLASIIFRLVAMTTPIEGFEAWDAVLGPVLRISLASLAGYLVGQLLNSLVVVRMKARFKERQIAGRLIVSTIVGELIDTIVFCTVAWVGVLSVGELVSYTMSGYIYKVLIEIIVIPITLLVIRKLKQIEPTYVFADQPQLAAF